MYLTERSQSQSIRAYPYGSAIAACEMCLV